MRKAHFVPNPVLFFLALAAVSAGGAEISQASELSICRQSFISPAAESDGNLGPETRIKIICSLRDALAEKYAFWKWKEAKLKLSSDHLLESCAKFEAGLPFSNRLYFEERVQLCLAQFQDSHLFSRSQTERPQIFAGVELQETNGKFMISALSRGVAKFLGASPAYHEAIARLALGKGVIAINGLSPERWIARLSPYYSGSSPEAVRAQAIKGIFQRDFAYPDTAGLRILLEGAETELIIPWWSIGVNQRRDLRELFARLEIRNVSRLGASIEKKISEGTDRLGFSEYTPLPHEEELTEFYTDKGKLGLRIGTIGREGKTACYLQLLTLETSKWRPSPNSNLSIAFEAPLGATAASCQSRGLPTVLDLRSNPGGDPENARKLFALFMRKETRAGGILFSGRVTQHLVQLLESYKLGDGFPDSPDPAFQPNLRYGALEIALQIGSAYLPWAAQDDILPNKLGGAYELPITILISPFCVSSCELAAGLFRDSHRARLLGTPTAGTGGRYLEIGGTPSAGWRDDSFGTVTVKIPNTILSWLPGPREPGPRYLDFPANINLMRENRPIQPDVFHSTTPGDIESAGADLLEKALSH